MSFDWMQFNQQLLQISLYQQMEEQNRLIKEQTQAIKGPSQPRPSVAPVSASAQTADDVLHALLSKATGSGATAEDMCRLGLHFLQIQNGFEGDIWLRKAANLGNADAMATLGYYLRQIGNIQEAIFWWHKAANQGHASAANSYIFEFLIPEKRWADVEKYAIAAYQANVFRESTNALSNSAIALYLQGRTDDAIARFKLALERDDKFAETEACWWLARIYAERGDQEQSTAYRNRSEIAGGYQAPAFV